MIAKKNYHNNLQFVPNYTKISYSEWWSCIFWHICYLDPCVSIGERYFMWLWLWLTTITDHNWALFLFVSRERERDFINEYCHIYEQDMWVYKLNIALWYLSPHSIQLWIHLKMRNYHTTHIRLVILLDLVSTYGVYGKRWGPYLIPLPANPRSTWEKSHIKATNMGTILLNLVCLDRSNLS